MSGPLQPEKQLHRSGVDVVEIGDQLGHYPPMVEHRADDARRTVMERSHRVEHMARVLQAQLHHPPDLLESRQAVTDGGHHALPDQARDEAHRFTLLWGEGQHFDRSPRGGLESAPFRRRQRVEVTRGRHAGLSRGEMWSLQMDAQRARA